MSAMQNLPPVALSPSEKSFPVSFEKTLRVSYLLLSLNLVQAVVSATILQALSGCPMRVDVRIEQVNDIKTEDMPYVIFP